MGEKMRILYLTTSLERNVFDSFVNGGRKLNPAGQNFHGKMIEALKMQDDVEVISLLPFPSIALKGNYHYVQPIGNKILKLLFQPKKIIEATHGVDFDVIVYDSLNVSLAKAAKKLAKQKQRKRIAILTDNPYNITGVNSTYCKNVISLSKDADGYFALSKGLFDAFSSKKDAPCLIKKGVVREPSKKKLKLEPYIYFGGALYSRYGVDKLINAYNEAKPPYKLLIAGHGQLKDLIIEEDKKEAGIKFLGQLNEEDNRIYQSNASILVNPRPYEEELERNSIPSKMLEYLSSGKKIISGPNKALEEEFGESLNIINGDIGEGLIKIFSSLKGKDELKENTSKDDVLNKYGLKAISDEFHHFLEAFIK